MDTTTTDGLIDIEGVLSEVDDADWMDQALCAQTDPEAFFPEKGGSTREAKKVCKSCEVRDECLAWAIENKVRFGIWGGLSDRERRKLEKLADINAQLPGGTSPRAEPAAEAATPGAPTAKEIRSWAHDAGIKCPGTGRIPHTVRAAYLEAHATDEAA
jgi:WhiB family redox-sensing transcriptional regulator